MVLRARAAQSLTAGWTGGASRRCGVDITNTCGSGFAPGPLYRQNTAAAEGPPVRAKRIAGHTGRASARAEPRRRHLAEPGMPGDEVEEPPFLAQIGR